MDGERRRRTKWIALAAAVALALTTWRITRMGEKSLVTSARAPAQASLAPVPYDAAKPYRIVWASWDLSVPPATSEQPKHEEESTEPAPSLDGLDVGVGR